MLVLHQLLALPLPNPSRDSFECSKNQTVPVKGKSKKSLAGIYFLVFWQNKKSVCFHLVGSHSLLRLQSPLEGLS